MTKEEKLRLWQRIRPLLTVGALGFVYWLFVELTGWRIPCPIYEITGLHCPGCGITRMCLALVRLDFVAAAHNNLFALSALPIACGMYAYKTLQYVRTGKTTTKTWEQALYVVLLVLCVTFSVLRNWGICPVWAPL